MNDASGALQRLGAALSSGDRDFVMACFAADAVVEVVSDEELIAFTGDGIREAIDMLLVGFDHLKLTPTARQVSASRVVQESVLSGDHTGGFAGSQPNSGRVRVNVKLSATVATDSNLQSLSVEADTRALFAQIAGTDDVLGVTGALIAAARERHDGAVRIIDAEGPPGAAAATDATPPSTSGSGRGWAALVVAAVLLLMGFLGLRPAPTGRAIDAQAHLATGPQTPTNRPTVAPRKPEPAPSPGALTALPVIAIAAPKSMPYVQPGRQVVLKSDVLFGFDSAVLAPAARTALTRVAKQVHRAGVTGTIQVNGYTDNLGSVAYDLALSRARAMAVAGILQKGLAGQRVTLAPQGFGQANPVARNTSEPGRARNRRVTVVLPTLR
jgi:outer membrane protein OmpA-like peptidoglycan-associated protein